MGVDKLLSIAFVIAGWMIARLLLFTLARRYWGGLSVLCIDLGGLVALIWVILS